MKDLKTANAEKAKIIGKTLISNITESMADIKFSEIEQQVKTLILALLEKPIAHMNAQSEVLSTADSMARKNLRRINEIDQTVQKF